MADWTVAPDTVWRTYNTDGVPSSGFHNPNKSEIAALFQAFGKPVETLRADRVYYLNASSGSDSNSGATSGTALATVQAAINKASQLNLEGHRVGIYLADGTYDGFQMLWRPHGVGREAIEIIGNGADPDAVHIDSSTFGCAVTNGAQLKISNVKLQGVYSAYSEDPGSKLWLNNCVVDGVNNADSVLVYARRSGEIEVNDTPIYFPGNGTPDAYFQFSHGGRIWLQDAEMTLTGNGTVGIATAFGLVGGSELVVFGASVTWTLNGYNVTGKKHVVRAAEIQAIGETTSFFPGTVAGELREGGQFVVDPT